jgi:hypothetical protein
MSASPSLEDGKRSFTVARTDAGKPGGRYISKTPYQAASKAARLLFQESGKKAPIRFTLKETTRGSDGKEFKYTATKSKLDKPVVFFKGTEKEYSLEHKYSIKSCRM